MLKILVSAYACSPGLGSEPGMAWNWCRHLARHCELHIITEGEFRERIEAQVAVIPEGRNMHFYYHPVPERIRRMCWNQGDWRFYGHYRKWQREVLEIARGIVRTERIDILHQLNMVGFREPGYLWKIAGIPLVWGPVAGVLQIPGQYLVHMGWRFGAFYALKNTISRLQLRFPRIRKMIAQADFVLTATPEMQRAIGHTYGTTPLLITETACELHAKVERRVSREGTFHLLWVGRFLPGKQLRLALETMRKLTHLDIRLHIAGEGFTPAITRSYHDYARRIGVAERCEWHGKVSNEEVMRLMQRCHLFFFTSIMEATSTVVPEAIQNGLPVLCFDTCGFGPLVTPDVGVKIPLTTPREARELFARQISDFYSHRSELGSMSAACLFRREELGWERKIETVVALYKELLEAKEL